MGYVVCESKRLTVTTLMDPRLPVAIKEWAILSQASALRVSKEQLKVQRLDVGRSVKTGLR
jgi:hypothetical protein